MKRSRSQEAFQRACKLIPGGVNSPARAFGAVGGQPLFIARGEGPYLFDVDGYQYLDYIGSWGPLILGHAHPRVVTMGKEKRPTPRFAGRVVLSSAPGFVESRKNLAPRLKTGWHPS